MMNQQILCQFVALGNLFSLLVNGFSLTQNEKRIIRKDRYFECKCGAFTDTISLRNLSMITSNTHSLKGSECRSNYTCLGYTCTHIYSPKQRRAFGEYEFISSFGCINVTAADLSYFIACMNDDNREYIDCCAGNHCNAATNVTAKVLDYLLGADRDGFLNNRAYVVRKEAVPDKGEVRRLGIIDPRPNFLSVHF
ncbi:hypothetical protein ACOME3_002161 [Neoechinorhynchus agilis]